MSNATCGLGAALLALLLAAALAGPVRAESPMPAGYPGRGRIGMEVQPMTAELREYFRAPAEAGLLVVRLEAGRPAAAGELRVGDVVIAAAGEPLVRPQDLVAIVARAPAGEPLALTVVRKGRTRTLSVLPEGEPATAAALDAWHERIGSLPPAATPPSAPGATEPPLVEPTPDGAVSPPLVDAPLQPVVQPVPGFAPLDTAPPLVPTE